MPDMPDPVLDLADLDVLDDFDSDAEFDDILDFAARKAHGEFEDAARAELDEAAHEGPLRSFLLELREAGGVVAWVKKQFSKHEHPRWPAGTPGGKGGQFMQVGERFVGADGKPYEITAFQNGKVYAHLATGKAADVKTISLTPTAASDGGLELAVAPAPPVKVTGSKSFKADAPGTIVIDPAVKPQTHNPSLAPPGTFSLSADQWKRFGEEDQERVIELEKRFGQWSPGKAKTLISQIKSQYDYEVQSIVESALSSQYGSSSGYTLSLAQVFKETSDPAKLAAAQAKYEKAKLLLEDSSSAIQWDLYHRVKSPDVATFHWGTTGVSSWTDKFYEQGLPVMAAYSLSTGFTQTQSFAEGTGNFVAVPMAIRHVHMHTHSGGLYTSFSHEDEITTGHRMKLKQGEALLGNINKLPSEVVTYLKKHAQKEHNPVSGEHIYEALKAINDPSYELPVPPEPPGIQAVPVPGQKTYEMPPVNILSSQGIDIFKLGYAGGSKEVAEKPANQHGFEPGDMMEGLKGTRYALIEDTSSNQGIRYVKVDPDTGQLIPGKSYALSGDQPFRKLDGKFVPPSKPEAEGYTPMPQAEIDALKKAGPPVKLAQASKGMLFQIDGTTYKVKKPQSDTGTKPVLENVLTGKEVYVNSGYKASPVGTDGSWTPPPEAAPAPGVTPTPEQVAPVHKPKLGEIFLGPKNPNMPAGIAGEIAWLYEADEDGTPLLRMYGNPGMPKAAGATAQKIMDAAKPFPKIGPETPEVGDSFAHDGKKYVVSSILVNGTVRAKPTGGKVEKFEPGHPALKGLFRPDAYVIGDKAKLSSFQAGQLFHGGTGAKTRPYLVLGSTASFTHVQNLDTGEISKISSKQSKAVLSPAPETPTDDPKPQGPGGKHALEALADGPPTTMEQFAASGGGYYKSYTGIAGKMWFDAGQGKWLAVALTSDGEEDGTPASISDETDPSKLLSVFNTVDITPLVPKDQGVGAPEPVTHLTFDASKWEPMPLGGIEAGVLKVGVVAKFGDDFYKVDGPSPDGDNVAVTSLSTGAGKYVSAASFMYPHKPKEDALPVVGGKVTNSNMTEGMHVTFDVNGISSGTYYKITGPGFGGKFPAVFVHENGVEQPYPPGIDLSGGNGYLHGSTPAHLIGGFNYDTLHKGDNVSAKHLKEGDVFTTLLHGGDAYFKVTVPASADGQMDVKADAYSPKGELLSAGSYFGPDADVLFTAKSTDGPDLNPLLSPVNPAPTEPTPTKPAKFDPFGFPEASFDPYLHPKGGKKKNDKITLIADGTVFKDKSGKLFMKLNGTYADANIVTDGEAIYRVNGDLRGQVVPDGPTTNAFVANSKVDSSMLDASAPANKTMLADRMVDTPDGMTISDLKVGDYLMKPSSAAGIYKVVEQGDTFTTGENVETGNHYQFSSFSVPEKVFQKPASSEPEGSMGKFAQANGLEAGSLFYDGEDGTPVIAVPWDAAIEPSIATQASDNKVLLYHVSEKASAVHTESTMQGQLYVKAANAIDGKAKFGDKAIWPSNEGDLTGTIVSNKISDGVTYIRIKGDDGGIWDAPQNEVYPVSEAVSTPPQGLILPGGAKTLYLGQEVGLGVPYGGLPVGSSYEDPNGEQWEIKDHSGGQTTITSKLNPEDSFKAGHDEHIPQDAILSNIGGGGVASGPSAQPVVAQPEAIGLKNVGIYGDDILIGDTFPAGISVGSLPVGTIYTEGDGEQLQVTKHMAATTIITSTQDPDHELQLGHDETVDTDSVLDKPGTGPTAFPEGDQPTLMMPEAPTLKAGQTGELSAGTAFNKTSVKVVDPHVGGTPTTGNAKVEVIDPAHNMFGQQFEVPIESISPDLMPAEPGGFDVSAMDAPVGSYLANASGSVFHKTGPNSFTVAVKGPTMTNEVGSSMNLGSNPIFKVVPEPEGVSVASGQVYSAGNPMFTGGDNPEPIMKGESYELHFGIGAPEPVIALGSGNDPGTIKVQHPDGGTGAYDADFFRPVSGGPKKVEHMDDLKVGDKYAFTPNPEEWNDTVFTVVGKSGSTITISDSDTPTIGPETMETKPFHTTTYVIGHEDLPSGEGAKASTDLKVGDSFLFGPDKLYRYKVTSVTDSGFTAQGEAGTPNENFEDLYLHDNVPTVYDVQSPPTPTTPEPSVGDLTNTENAQKAGIYVPDEAKTAKGDLAEFDLVQLPNGKVAYVRDSYAKRMFFPLGEMEAANTTATSFKKVHLSLPTPHLSELEDGPAGNSKYLPIGSFFSFNGNDFMVIGRGPGGSHYRRLDNGQIFHDNVGHDVTTRKIGAPAPPAPSAPEEPKLGYVTVGADEGPPGMDKNISGLTIGQLQPGDYYGMHEYGDTWMVKRVVTQGSNGVLTFDGNDEKTATNPGFTPEYLFLPPKPDYGHPATPGMKVLVGPPNSKSEWTVKSVGPEGVVVDTGISSSDPFSHADVKAWFDAGAWERASAPDTGDAGTDSFTALQHGAFFEAHGGIWMKQGMGSAKLFEKTHKNQMAPIGYVQQWDDDTPVKWLPDFKPAGSGAPGGAYQGPVIETVSELFDTPGPVIGQTFKLHPDGETYKVVSATTESGSLRVEGTETGVMLPLNMGSKQKIYDYQPGVPQGPPVDDNGDIPF